MKEKPKKSRPTNKQLTPSQETFCQHYASPGPGGVLNALEAYRSAFPRCKTVRSAQLKAYRLLANGAIRDRIAELQLKHVQKLEIKAERVLTELARIAFANVSDFVRWDAAGNVEWIPSDELSDEAKAAIKEVIGENGRWKKRIRLHDKVAALEKLAKYLGLFTEKVDVTSGGQPIAALSHEERIERIVALFQSAEVGHSRSDSDHAE